MIIAIDFDGTCCTHNFPDVGRSIGAEAVLRRLVAAGHKLILWTCRSDTPLQDAIQWFNAREIPLFAVNCSPGQSNWSISPKAFAALYIDDAALGAPLILDGPNERPYLDWKKVEIYLEARGLV